MNILIVILLCLILLVTPGGFAFVAWVLSACIVLAAFAFLLVVKLISLVIWELPVAFFKARKQEKALEKTIKETNARK